MSAIVCQGLQSCLEPGFLEPRAIIDKLAPPTSNFSQSMPWTQNPNVFQEQEEEKHNSWNEDQKLMFNKCGFDDGEQQSNNDEGLCWSFIQALSNASTTQTSQEGEEQVYIHPLAKRSSSTLSAQSLEMCTEGLGSETGSNNDEIMADLSCISCEIKSSEGIQRSRSKDSFTKKLERHGTFPPPLTLISGSDGIQLRPHREGGRLVLKAVTFCRKSCFQAERIDGRLRLFSLSKDGYNNFDEEISQYEEDNKNEELGRENAAEEQDSRVKDIGAYDLDGSDENDYSEEEGTQGSGGGKLGSEIESEEFPRLSRCNRARKKVPGTQGLIGGSPFGCLFPRRKSESSRWTFKILVQH